jgi:hypothetical protein
LKDWGAGLFSGCFPHTLASVDYHPLPRIGSYV